MWKNFNHLCIKSKIILSQVKQTVGAVLINMVVSIAYNPFMYIKKIRWNFNKSLPTFIQHRFP